MKLPKVGSNVIDPVPVGAGPNKVLTVVLGIFALCAVLLFGTKPSFFHSFLPREREGKKGFLAVVNNEDFHWGSTLLASAQIILFLNAKIFKKMFLLKWNFLWTKVKDLLKCSFLKLEIFKINCLINRHLPNPPRYKSQGTMVVCRRTNSLLITIGNSHILCGGNGL